jgi:hypothetical protein
MSHMLESRRHYRGRSADCLAAVAVWRLSIRGGRAAEARPGKLERAHLALMDARIARASARDYGSALP